MDTITTDALERLIAALLALAQRRARQLTPASDLPAWSGGRWATAEGVRA
jgi:hypothetical protein